MGAQGPSGDFSDSLRSGILGSPSHLATRKQQQGCWLICGMRYRRMPCKKNRKQGRVIRAPGPIIRSVGPPFSAKTYEGPSAAIGAPAVKGGAAYASSRCVQATAQCAGIPALRRLAPCPYRIRSSSAHCSPPLPSFSLIETSLTDHNVHLRRSPRIRVRGHGRFTEVPRETV
jgi:hypothetical protein